MTRHVEVDDLLDDWENRRAKDPALSLDTFIDRHCAGLSADCIAAFRDKAAKLAAIDDRLRAVEDVSPHNRSSSSQPESDFAEVNLAAGNEVVPGYTLTARLGGGGFGEVWKARGPGGFQVALKFVPIEGRAGQLESRSLDIIRDVRHPHLLPVFGTWRIGGALVIAMELADRTVLDRFQEARKEGYEGIPRDELLNYMEDAAKGIDFLNEPATPGRQRIQHRDIKPQNLLLSGGSVKIGDFGLARCVQFDVAGHTSSLTFAYAAPECFDGATSNRSDQYSLAVTYCLLRGGRLPFDGTPVQLMEGHRKKQPDLSMLPVDERPAVAKALSKHPKDRWPSCASFVESLHRTLPDVETGQRNKRTLAVTGFAILALTLFLLALLAFRKDRKNGDADQPARPNDLPAPASVASTKGPLTVAVLDFDNHSQDESLDGFRLGFRDMLVTDLSKVGSLRVLERSRLAALLREHDLAKSPFIDQKSAIRLGRGLSAHSIVTGSFTIKGDDIRIDVRMASTETGEIILADGIEGKKMDLFRLQKALSKKVLGALHVTVSGSEQQALDASDIGDFEAFRLFSEARLAQLRGEREKAERQFRASLARSPGFQLASRELHRMENDALARLSEDKRHEAASASEIAQRLSEHRRKYQRIVEANTRDGQYFAGLLMLAAHAGLVGDFDRERQLLLSYWARFSESVPPEQVWSVGAQIREIVIKEGRFFQDQVDSGEYGILVLDLTPDDKYLRPELRQSFHWPRWTVFWPFNKTMRASYDTLRQHGKTDDAWFDKHLPRFPHDYLEGILEVFSGRDIEAFRRRQKESVELLTSILEYLAKSAQNPDAAENLQSHEDTLLYTLAYMRAEEWDTDFLKRCTVPLERFAKTLTAADRRDTANRTLIRFLQQIRINEGKNQVGEKFPGAEITFCTIALQGPTILFCVDAGGGLIMPPGDPRFFIQSELTDAIRAMTPANKFDIRMYGRVRGERSALFDEFRQADAQSQKTAIGFASNNRSDFHSGHGTTLQSALDAAISQWPELQKDGGDICLVCLKHGMAKQLLADEADALVKRLGTNVRVHLIADERLPQLATLPRKTRGKAVLLEKGSHFSVKPSPWNLD
jgi:serine/threonine protein kinase